MTTVTQPITKVIGKTERTLQALLDVELQKAGVSFPEWTVLVFLGSANLTRAALISALGHGQIARGQSADAVIVGLEAKGYILDTDASVQFTEAGTKLFTPLRTRVQSITAKLVAEIPNADLDTTHRTLAVVIARAESMLGEPAT